MAPTKIGRGAADEDGPGEEETKIGESDEGEAGLRDGCGLGEGLGIGLAEDGIGETNRLDADGLGDGENGAMDGLGDGDRLDGARLDRAMLDGELMADEGLADGLGETIRLEGLRLDRTGEGLGEGVMLGASDDARIDEELGDGLLDTVTLEGARLDASEDEGTAKMLDRLDDGWRLDGNDEDAPGDAAIELEANGLELGETGACEEAKLDKEIDGELPDMLLIGPNTTASGVRRRRYGAKESA